MNPYMFIMQADGRARVLRAYDYTLARPHLLARLRSWVWPGKTPTQYLCACSATGDYTILATIYRSKTHHASRDEIRARMALGGLTFVSHL